jgi:hypothetical protein
MAERAAHLVDHVFPEVPVRQWVLTVPHRVRYLLAWDHALCRAVVGVFMRTVLRLLRGRARCEQGVADGRSGAVVILQRFGAALNVNVHGHALVLDGIFAEDSSGGLSFYPAIPPTDDEMDQVLATIARRVQRMLARRGVIDDDANAHRADRWAEAEPVLAGIVGASVQGRLALGPRAGAEVRRSGSSPELPAVLAVMRGRCHAHADGFDLHARVVIPGRDRAPVGARLPLCSAAAGGRRPYPSDGHGPGAPGTAASLERWDDPPGVRPLEFLERLAALNAEAAD